MEILNVKIIDGGWKVNDKFTVTDTEGAKYRDEVLEHIANGGVVEPKFTDTEIEATRISDITSKATQVIESKYSPLKQRKMMSISIWLLSAGDALTQDIVAANEWITAIRAIENTAITDGVLLDKVIWDV